MSEDNKAIEIYIEGFPEEVRKSLHILQKTIDEEIPDAEKVISYGIPTYKLNGTYIVYFAAFKKHISLYPVSDETLKSLKKDSTYIIAGKGTIQFPIDKPLPLSLIRKIVKSLLRESLIRQDIR
jgi:uncharacterized protein YdhG (YjbR/CyaY superfamily)